MTSRAGNFTDTPGRLDSNTQADGSILSTVILYLAKEVKVAKYRLVAAADNERRQPVSWEVGIAGTEGGFFPLSTVSEGSAGATYYMVASASAHSPPSPKAPAAPRAPTSSAHRPAGSAQTASEPREQDLQVRF